MIYAQLKVEKVDNGYIIKPGSGNGGKPVVVEGHGAKKLAEVIARLLGVKEEDGDGQ